MMLTWDVSFDRFRLDRANERLLRDGTEVALTPKAYAVLEFLLQRAGSLVRKGEILDALWPDAAVGDAVLKFNVAQLRQALGDDARAPRFIETVHRRGYRFVAPLGPVPADADDGRGAEPGAPALVGREGELERLDALVEAARRGMPSVALVSGPAGIGKTALVEALLQRVSHMPGVMAARGDCSPGSLRAYGQSHLPVVRALTQLCRGPQGAVVREVVRRTAPTWCDRMPWMVAHDDRDRLTGEVLSAPRSRLLRELGELVRRLSVTSTFVLVLEDLHWADGATLEAFEAVAGLDHGVRMLLVGTCRPGSGGGAEAPLARLQHVLQGCQGFSPMELAPLDESAVAALLDRRFPGSRAGETLAGPVFLVTEGLPLFVGSVMDDLLETGEISQRNGRWVVAAGAEKAAHRMPDGLRSMISRRLADLGPQGRAVLEAAAVAGDSFPAPLISRALQLDPLDAELACEALVDGAQLLLRDGVTPWAGGAGAGRYRFAHTLFRAVAMESMSAARRRELHRLAAACLQERAEAGSTAEAADLAWHLECAGDGTAAARYALAAARGALAASEPREALEIVDHALEVLARDAGGGAVVEAELRITRGLAARLAGDLPTASGELEKAVSLAQEAGRTDLAVTALLHRSTVLFWLDRPACIEAALQARECSAQSPPTPAVAGGVRLHDDARGAAAALEAARRIGDPELVQLWRALGAPHAILRGDYAAACEDAEAGVRACLDARDAFHHMLCRLDLGWALFYAGRWGESLALVLDGIDTAERNALDLTLFSFEVLALWLHRHLHDRAGAARYGRRLAERAGALRLDPLTGGVVRSVASLGEGETGPFLQGTHHVAGVLAATGMATDWLLVLPMQVEALDLAVAGGDAGTMDEEAARLADLAEVSGDPVHLALAARGRAEAALAEKNFRRADEWAERARVLLVALDAPGALQRVATTSARLHRLLGRAGDEAREWAAAARVFLRLARSLGEFAGARDRFLAAPAVSAVLREARRRGAALPRPG